METRITPAGIFMSDKDRAEWEPAIRELNEVEAEFYIGGLRKENDELRERCGGLFIQIDHLLDLLASSEGWDQCPYWVASHIAWEPHTIPLHVRLEWVRPYHDEVARICGCDPDNGGRGCYHTHRECWGKFIEQAPEWWWSVLTDRPTAVGDKPQGTLF